MELRNERFANVMFNLSTLSLQLIPRIKDMTLATAFHLHLEDSVAAAYPQRDYSNPTIPTNPTVALTEHSLLSGLVKCQSHQTNYALLNCYFDTINVVECFTVIC